MQKVPYMLVVGDKEVENNAVAVRDRKEGDRGSMALDEFIGNIQKEIREKINK